MTRSRDALLVQSVRGPPREIFPRGTDTHRLPPGSRKKRWSSEAQRPGAFPREGIYLIPSLSIRYRIAMNVMTSSYAAAVRL